MHKKSFLIIALLILASALLPGCQQAALTEADCSRVDFLCVGLVTGLDGIDDKSINQAAWEGILKTKEEKIADLVNYIETIDSKDYEQNITRLAEDGHDIIVTVGSQLGEATVNAANRFPEVLFIGVDQVHGDQLPNLVALVFHDDQSGFLAGALAAQMTRSNTIAAVYGAQTIPSMSAFEEGFEAGARFINPNIYIISNYYPGDPKLSLSDPKWGAEAALQAIEAGADVIFGSGGKTGTGALIEAAGHPGVYCIGVDTDQWQTLPGAHACLITSSMKLISPGVYNLVSKVKEGVFTSGVYYGASGLAPYHDFEAVLTQAVKDNMNSIAAEIQNGSLTTAVGP